jgi:hypothetical protein
MLKITGTFATVFPEASKTLAVRVAGRPCKIRVESEVSLTKLAFRLPIVTATVSALEQPTLDAWSTRTQPVADATGDGEGEGEGDGVVLGGVVVGVVAGPPEKAVTHAIPERLSATRFTRATPSIVVAWSLICPRFVKNWTTVPSATPIPSGRVTRTVMTETPPFAAMNGGCADRKRVDPAGAVKITGWHVSRVRQARERSEYRTANPPMETLTGRPSLGKGREALRVVSQHS